MLQAEQDLYVMHVASVVWSCGAWRVRRGFEFRRIGGFDSRRIGGCVSRRGVVVVVVLSSSLCRVEVATLHA